MAATFIGIVVTLSTFGDLGDPLGVSQEQLEERFTKFLSSAGFAFRASAFGVCMSIVATISNRFFLEAEEEEGFNDAAQALIKTQNATLDKLEEVGGTVTKQATKAMESAGEQFKAAAAEALAVLKQGGEEAGEAFAKSLDVASGRLSESLCDASAAILQAGQTVTQAAAGVSDLVEGIKEVAAEFQVIAQTQETTSQQLASTEKNIQLMVGNLQTLFDRQSAALTGFNELKSAASNGFHKLLQDQKDSTDALNRERQAVKDVAAELRPIADAFALIPKKLEELLAAATNHTERIDLAAQSLAALENLDDRLGPPIQKLVSSLDKQMTEVLRKITTRANSRMEELKAGHFDSAIIVAAASSANLKQIEVHLTKMDAHHTAMGKQVGDALEQLNHTAQDLRRATASLSAAPPAAIAEPIS